MNITKYFLIAASLFAGLLNAAAHLSVGGDRTLGVVDNTTVTNGNRTVSGSFGWADGTDANWGDSHRLTAFKFTLNTTQDVSITVSRRNAGTGPAGTLLPAFSVFQTPLFRASTHDSGPATTAYLTTTFGNATVGESFTNTNGSAGYEAGDSFVDTNSNTTWDAGEQYIDANGAGIWEFGDSFTDSNSNGVHDGAGIGRSGKEGAFRALDPWTIYVDAVDGLPMYFDTVIGHKADGTASNYGSASGISGDGVADGTVTATFSGLGAGDYYILVGGANYAAQNSADVLAGGTTFRTYGINLAVSAVPEPSTYALLALGAGGLALVRRLRNSKK
ncbi:MAG: PEP-CTERM sorting domain-containing protein [Terrimicrobiaceae bacterium]